MNEQTDITKIQKNSAVMHQQHTRTFAWAYLGIWGTTLTAVSLPWRKTLRITVQMSEAIAKLQVQQRHRVSWIRNKSADGTFSSPHQILGHTETQECGTLYLSAASALSTVSFSPPLTGTYQLSEPPAVGAADKLRSLSVNSRVTNGFQETAGLFELSLDHLTGQLQG